MFKEYYQKKLIAEINKAAGKEELKAGANVMDIMEKLSYLSASEATPDGEKRYWIPLYWKRILVKAIWGMDVVVTTKLTSYKPNTSATATTVITVDGKEAAFAEAHRAYETIALFDNTISGNAKDVLMRQYVMATSEKMAYYRLGICMDYTGDIEESEPITYGNQKLEPTTPSELEDALDAVDKLLKEEETETSTEPSTESSTETSHVYPSDLDDDIDMPLPEEPVTSESITDDPTSDSPTPDIDLEDENDELPFIGNTPTEDFEVAIVGPEHILGKKLEELEPKFIACLAANIANKKDGYTTVSEAYYNHLMEIINADTTGVKQKLYATYLKK